MSAPAIVRPDCCALGARNLQWFAASPPDGAWHPSSFRFGPEDAPTSVPLSACPFCGRPLGRPDGA